MKTSKIYESETSFHRGTRSDNVYKVNPIELYKSEWLEIAKINNRDIRVIQKLPIIEDLITLEAEYSVSEYLKEIRVPIPENFIKLLETTKKSEQENLLKRQSLTTDQFFSFIMLSFEKFGFLYSRIRVDININIPKGAIIPKMAIKEDDGSIRSIGKTTLTEGQIKNMIDHRKVIVAHLFEKADIWHCLFLTYRSLAGKENHDNGQSHFHYFSSAFTIPREDFIKSLENGKYLATSIHIPLIDYGHQTK